MQSFNLLSSTWWAITFRFHNIFLWNHYTSKIIFILYLIEVATFKVVFSTFSNFEIINFVIHGWLQIAFDFGAHIKELMPLNCFSYLKSCLNFWYLINREAEIWKKIILNDETWLFRQLRKNERDTTGCLFPS